MSTGVVHSEDRIRLKDLVRIKGVRSNQLSGIGLVVGLPGTGDSNGMIQAMDAYRNYLFKYGFPYDQNEVTSASVALVSVTADLPTFSQVGDKIDVSLSAIGDANNLQGGELLMTQLYGPDRKVYAVASGGIKITPGASVLTRTNILSGAVVEREYAPKIMRDEKIILSLINPDFTTNARISERINHTLKGFFAKSISVRQIDVYPPEQYRENLIEFLSLIENIRITPDSKAKITIDSNTGAIIIGRDVVVKESVLSYKNLSITIGNEKVDVQTPAGKASNKDTTVGSLVDTLNAMGMQTGDMVTIISTLHKNGSINAEVEIF